MIVDIVDGIVDVIVDMIDDIVDIVDIIDDIVGIIFHAFVKHYGPRPYADRRRRPLAGPRRSP